MKKQYRTYLSALLVGIGTVLTTIVTSAILVDPYAIYRDRDEYVGLNKYARLIRPHWAEAHQPQVVVAGSSRAEYFFDMKALSDETGLPVFNIALSGANIYEVRRNVEHVVAVAPISTVIVGLDFFMFNEMRNPQPGFDEGRLATGPDGRDNPFYWLSDLPGTLASQDVLNEIRRSIKYRDKDTRCENRWTIDGGTTPTQFECQLSEPNGQQDMFRAGLAVYLDDASGLLGGFKLDTTPLPSNSMQNIDRLIELAASDRELILYLSPLHALHMDVIKRWGLWPTFENWKRTLVRKVADAQKRGVRVELRDFAIVSDLTTRSVFERDAGIAGEFYDSNHLNMRQRSRVQKALFGLGSAQNSISILLTPEMLEAHLSGNRLALADWVAAHPTDMGVLAELAAAAN
jgi:hypothetical protein